MIPGKRKASSCLQAESRKRPPRCSIPSENEGFEINVTPEEVHDWPAPRTQIALAQEFIGECVYDKHLTLLVPDKDADGLSSCKIVYETLLSLGHPSSLIKVHHVAKCASIFHASEKASMESFRATRIIVLDQGSRGNPALVSQTIDLKPVKTLIIDHHESTRLPSGALVVPGCRTIPVPTASMIAYAVCRTLLPSQDICDNCAAFAVVGIFGDLGLNGVNLNQHPWPSEFGRVVREQKKTVLRKVVGLINAPRRTELFNVQDAWTAILEAPVPSSLIKSRTLTAAREDVNREVERVMSMRSPPHFSKDGRVAWIKIQSTFQIHPVIAARWAGRLTPKTTSKTGRGTRLEMVMVSNDRYHPSGSFTNFSCRAVVVKNSNERRSAVTRPDLIELLLEYARAIPDSDSFFKNVSGEFAKGHKEATGGIIPTTEFNKLVSAIKFGDQDEGQRTKVDAAQAKLLTDYFKKG